MEQYELNLILCTSVSSLTHYVGTEILPSGEELGKGIITTSVNNIITKSPQGTPCYIFYELEETIILYGFIIPEEKLQQDYQCALL